MTTRTLAVARPILGTTLPFALPIGLSAFLLFSVEPLIGRLVLPVFGGRDLAKHLTFNGLESRHLEPYAEDRELAHQLALL